MAYPSIDWAKYREYMKNAPTYVPPEDIPQIKIDYRGLIALAKKKGCQVAELSDAEKDPYIEGGMKHLREVRGW